MSFGRMNNMRRRASRPDEDFHRNRRRKRLDRSAMLDSRSSRSSLLVRAFRALVRLVSRR
jgi:hypothetical protein